MLFCPYLKAQAGCNELPRHQEETSPIQKHFYRTLGCVCGKSSPLWHNYYQAEMAKMLNCGSETNGFAVYQCLDCGKGEHKVNFSCKGKACLQCGERYARDRLRIPFYNHPNQHDLYSQFMVLAQACLTALIQGQFKDTDYKVALIVFLHTHGRNGRYNPHLHVILAEGAFHPRKKEWKAFKHLPLAPLRRLWQ